MVKTFSGCYGAGLAGIGQLADVVGPGLAHRSSKEQEISFTGWLGLLRALYEVTAEPGLRR